MRRREFIGLLGGALLSPAAAAQRERQSVPVVGWLSTAVAAQWTDLVEAFRQGLKEAGYEDGRNVRIEFRWTEGDDARLPMLANELVERKVDVIFTSGSHLAALAARAATSTIPIVFLSGNDPIEFGLVTSLSRPGGNVTGLSMVSSSLGSKQLGLLRDLIPNAATVALIANPKTNARSLSENLQKAAKPLGIKLDLLPASSAGEIDAAFASIVERRIEGIVMGNDTFLRSRTGQFVSLAARHAIPVIYPYREFAVAGGLLSYGTSLTAQNREAGKYVARILNGAAPAELPVLQPTTFELVINLKTAKTLGLAIPSGVLAIADEVIE